MVPFRPLFSLFFFYLSSLNSRGNQTNELLIVVQLLREIFISLLSCKKKEKSEKKKITINKKIELLIKILRLFQENHEKPKINIVC